AGVMQIHAEHVWDQELHAAKRVLWAGRLTQAEPGRAMCALPVDLLGILAVRRRMPAADQTNALTLEVRAVALHLRQELLPRDLVGNRPGGVVDDVRDRAAEHGRHLVGLADDHGAFEDGGVTLD